MTTPPNGPAESRGTGGRSDPVFASLGADAPPSFGPLEVTPRTSLTDTATLLAGNGAPAPVTRPRPRLRDREVGDAVNQPLLVLDLEQRAGEHPHTILWLGDASGRLPSAPLWSSDQPRIAGIRRGDVAAVVGTVTTWRDRRQLAIDSIRPLPPGQVRWQDLLPTIGDPAPWWALLDDGRSRLRATGLRATLALFFDDPAFRRRFGACPASTGGHHAKLGGLLQHTCEVAHLALTMGHWSPSADRDLLLAGAMLHDIGKLESYHWDGPFATTVRGYALGHVVLGSLLLDRAIRACPVPPLEPGQLELLHHLILSHHGRPEFGAPVRPLTLEAEILHYADDASAKTDAMASVLGDPSCFTPGEELSSRTLWQIDHRRAWRRCGDWGTG
jgi:3'-5' exoribonuclease